MKLDTTDLIDIQGMVKEYGVSRTRVYQWFRHPDFPLPLNIPHVRNALWSKKAVEAWRQRKA